MQKKLLLPSYKYSRLLASRYAFYASVAAFAVSCLFVVPTYACKDEETCDEDGGECECGDDSMMSSRLAVSSNGLNVSELLNVDPIDPPDTLALFPNESNSTSVGGGGDDPGAKHGDSARGPSGEGANPFHVFDGNVTRSITDLVVASQGGAPALNWTRYHNTIKRGYVRAFGAGGEWRHSWQYELILEPARKDKPRQIQMVYPSGFLRGFTQEKSGLWVAGKTGGRYQEKLKVVTGGFEVTLANDAKLFFAQRPSASPKMQYRLQTYTLDDKVTRFDYTDAGQLSCITDPEGKQITINYSDITVQTAVNERFQTIKALPAAGQWIEVAVPGRFDGNAYTAIRLLGADTSPLAVAEIECYVAGSAKPIKGVDCRSTGNDALAVMDGNASTFFAGTSPRKNFVDIEFAAAQPISRVRVLPAPGREKDVLNASIDGIRIADVATSCLTSVTASDGQSIAYEYATIADPVSLAAYPVLSHVIYPENISAKYSYTFIVPTRQPYLEKADDPYYKGRAIKIQYAYAQSRTPYSDGRIQSELNPDTGGIYATLEFDEKQPDVRRVHYSDMRTITYRVPRSTNGRVTERTDSVGRTTRYEYARKNKGGLRAVIEPNGRRTQYVRDYSIKGGEPISITRSDGISITIQRDKKSGNPLKITDSRGTITTFERDAKGRPTSIITKKNAAGPNAGRFASRASGDRNEERREKTERDAKGNITRQTLPDGTTKEYTRDDKGRVTTSRNRAGGMHQFTYNAQGRIATYSSPAGGVAKYEYDSLGRHIQTTRSDGSVYRFERNARGLITRKINPDGSARSYTYDNYGRKISETDEINRAAAWVYDNLGRITSYADFAGGMTRYDYTETPNGCGTCSLVSNPSRIVQPDGRIDEFLYDSEGRLIMQCIAAGTQWAATTLYAHDVANNLIQQTNPDGGVIRHTYNIDKRRISTTDPFGRTTYWSYDKDGNVLSQTDASGRTTDYVYDSEKNLIYTVTPDGAETTYTYDKENRCISTTDALGNTTRWNYNAEGDLVSVIDAAGGETRHDYDNAHRRIRTILPDGKRQSWTYNTLGQIMQTVTPDGLKTENKYDLNGRLVTVTSAPSGMSQTAPAIVRYTYDSAGRRTSVTDALNRTTRYDYNARNRVTVTTFPDGTQTRKEYDDASGLLLGDIDQLAHATRYTYTARGDMATLTDAKGNTYGFEYDNARRKTAMIYPDNSREQWTYEIGGRLASYTTRAGQVKTITYNADGRPVVEMWAPSGCAPDVSYNYDYMGRLSTADNGNALLSYTYDKLGRIESETSDIRALLPNMAPHTVGYLYDTLGRTSGLVYPEGMKVTYTYDSLGRMAKIHNGKKTPLATYSFDTQGRRSKIGRDNGVTTEYAYDLTNQVLAINHRDKAEGVLAYAHYEYDNMGRRISMSREGNVTDQYRYDTTSQLVGVEYGQATMSAAKGGRTDASVASLENGLTAETFTYDPLGNRLNHGQSNPNQTPLVENYATNNLNQYTRISNTELFYDHNGNLTNDGKQSYTYDAQNRLVRVESESCKAEFAYDSRNRCVIRRFHMRDLQGVWRYDESSSFVATYDMGWNILSDRNLYGKNIKTYIHGSRIDEIVASVEGGVNIYPLTDVLGSVICISDQRGKAQTVIHYTITGKPLAYHKNYRYLFTGREWIGAVELSDHRFRYYNPNSGRWLSPDPIGFKGGINIYAYIVNAYSVWVDLFGLACCEAERAAVDKADTMVKQAMQDVERATENANKSAQEIKETVYLLDRSLQNYQSAGLAVDGAFIAVVGTGTAAIIGAPTVAGTAIAVTLFIGSYITCLAAIEIRDGFLDDMEYYRDKISDLSGKLNDQNAVLNDASNASTEALNRYIDSTIAYQTCILSN